ncbi:hypothetical protein SDC9_79465 [bioreactor metagenome]|uniref:Uncharacterized protein n=1 Tax=bioreactor metagenome TaxID=1076179 RepID=A0A644YY03_9ZZZZ
MSVMGRHVNFHTLINNRFHLSTIRNKIFNRNDLEIEFFCDFHQLRQTRHGAVFIDYFNQRTGRIQSCKFG